MASGLVVARGLVVASGLLWRAGLPRVGLRSSPQNLTPRFISCTAASEVGALRAPTRGKPARHDNPASHKAPRVLIYVSRSAWAFCIMAQVFIMAGCYVWFPVDGRLLARRLFPGVAA